MIEKIVRNYLEQKLDIPVFMEEPAEVPESYLIIERTDKSIESHINTATLAIQSYARSLYEAAVLNEKVEAAMLDIVEMGVITRCSLNSSYNYTDTETHRYRYQAVFSVSFY